MKSLLNEKNGIYPPPAPPAKPVLPPSLIPALAQGIFQAEGNGEQLGAANNNWGDLRFTKYTQSLGATGEKNGFAVFPTRAIGDAACEQLCRDVAHDLMLGYPKPCTIQDFVKVYAEPKTQVSWNNYVTILLEHLPQKVATDLMSSLL